MDDLQKIIEVLDTLSERLYFIIFLYVAILFVLIALFFLFYYNFKDLKNGESKH